MLIIDVIKGKRKMTTEIMMIRILSSLVIKEENEEIGQLFAPRCDSMGSGDQTKEHKVISFVNIKVKKNTIKSQAEGIAMEAQISQYSIDTKWKVMVMYQQFIVIHFGQELLQRNM